jgi:hypothetical protein
MYVCMYVCMYVYININAYEVATQSFRTGRLERELQMVQLSDTKYSCVAVLWVSFDSITLCVASQQAFIVVSVYFVINSVRKYLDTFVYTCARLCVKRVKVTGYYSP